MKGSIKYSLLNWITFSLLFFSLCSCKNRDSRLHNENGQKNNNNPVKSSSSINENLKIQKVTFYIENSESMFGYISEFTEYVDVVSELAEKPKFAEEKTSREFYFINGGHKLNITSIGSNPSVLKNKLNTTGFRCGDITKSNLNSMFQIALNSAGDDSISILISDAIYDIGQPNAPFNALATEGKETRSKFIERLTYGDLQTIMIKLISEFNGYYYYASKKGKQKIVQQRPYYVWIFGESRLLNKYFSEEYINNLRGYEFMARFLKVDQINIPYQITSQKIKGSFKFDREVKNRLIDAKSDRNGQGFQFTIAVDFSALPFSDSYLKSINNYAASGNFRVLEIDNSVKKLHEITSFTPTHLITIFTNKSPYGNISITLKNVIPVWITNTNIDNELIINDTNHTFGFKFLTDAISEAYAYKNKEKDIVSFKIEILK